MGTPEPLPPRLRLILRASKLLTQLDWLDVSELTEELVVAQWTAPYELRECTVQWTRNPTSTDPQDRASCTFHFLNLTGGEPDASWTTADYTTIEGHLDTWWTAVKTMYRATTVLAEYVWRADGPAFRPFGSSLQPTLRRTARAVAGTEGTRETLPPQVAMTITERTAAQYTVEDVEGAGTQLRKRWGRIYMPAPTSVVVTDGRIGSAYRTNLAGNTATLYNSCRSAGFIPVMYSPTTGNAWSVDELAVDDVFDVIRSRRFDTVLARVVSATQA